MASSFESDEAFARRLQDQEMGTHAAADPQTPLMVINQIFVPMLT